MKRTSRLLIALVCGAIVAAFTAGPAAGVSTGSYAATADGIGLSLTVNGESIAEIGKTEAALDSNPTVTGSAAGIISPIVTTLAETSAPPDDEDLQEIFSQEIDPVLFVAVARGVSRSITSTGPTAANRGSVEDAEVTVSPLVGTAPFSAASEANIAATATNVVSEGHSDEVVIPVSLGVDLVEPLCEPLGQIIGELGEACEEAVSEAGDLVTVLEVDILPADVQCVLDRATNTASVPVAQAALLQIILFPGTANEQVIAVSAGQTIDIGDGTPLHVHAVVSDSASTVEGSKASASAAGLVLDLLELEEGTPTISVVASAVNCTVTGEPEKVLLPPPPGKQPPLPVTGAPLTLIYTGGGLMLAAGIGLMRFLRRKASA